MKRRMWYLWIRPRSGSSEKFLNSVTRLAPKKIVYISCNPETLARDLLFLTKKNYVVKEIQACGNVLIFTDHTESGDLA